MAVLTVLTQSQISTWTEVETKTIMSEVLMNNNKAAAKQWAFVSKED